MSHDILRERRNENFSFYLNCIKEIGLCIWISYFEEKNLKAGKKWVQNTHKSLKYTML